MNEALQHAATECGVVLLSEWPPWLLAAALGMAALALYFSWRGYRRSASRKRRFALFSLRFGAVGTALFIFLQPGEECRTVTRRPTTLIVALDTSRSMSVTDRGKAGSRLQRGQRAVQRLVDAMAQRGAEHRVEVFAFDESARPVTTAELEGFVADGDATRTQESLETVLSRRSRDDLAAVVIVSDGADNGILQQLQAGAATAGPATPAGARPGAPAAPTPGAEPADEGRSKAEKNAEGFFASLGAPVHGVIIGEREGLRDVAVAGVRADPLVFVHNAFEIDVDISVRGYAPMTLPVTLRRDETVVTTQVVRTRPGEALYHVSFKIQPERVGKFLYSITIPEQAGEATVENNRRDLAIKVIRDKIRVLQVVGRPSWDERNMRRLLKRNPNVDLISFFILRTPTDLTLVPPSELSLIPFPTRELFTEQINTFDLVIFQNFDFRPYEMKPYLAHVRRYVLEHGGAFAMVGGDISFGSGGYAGTELAEILPVTLPPATATDLLDTQRFKPLLTGDGKRHPVLRLVPGEANEAAWASLPELEGVNVVSGLRPGASALLRHPKLRAGDELMPVVAAMDVGKGRSLAVMTDTTWHWAFAGGERSEAAQGAGPGVPRSAARFPYQTFWNNAIRWLIRDPELELVRIVPEKEHFSPRESAIVEVRVQGRDYVPATLAEVKLEAEPLRPSAPTTTPADGGPGPSTLARIEKSGTTGEGGRWRVDLGKLPPGPYRLTARATLRGDDLGEAKEALLSMASPRELEDPRARPSTLHALAQRTGGVVWGEDDSPPSDLPLRPPRVIRIDQKRATGYWDNSLVLFAAILFLGAEWMLRRRWGYL